VLTLLPTKKKSQPKKKKMAKGKKEPPSKKEVDKKVQKVVEDKTFGVCFIVFCVRVHEIDEIFKKLVKKQE
jgi:hypothetical protein